MKYKDYYETLGVPRGATQDDIKQAYRKLARKYHPDVSKMADAEARFKEINEANEVLKDPEKRAAYDQMGSNWKARARSSSRRRTGTRASSSAAAGAGRSAPAARSAAPRGSIRATSSSRCSAAAAPAAGAPRRRGSVQGEDHHAKVLIDLEDAYRGAERSDLAARAGRDAPTAGSRCRSARSTSTSRRAFGRASTCAWPGRARPASAARAAGDLYLEIEFNPHRALSRRRQRRLRRPAARAVGGGARRDRRRADARGHRAADDPQRLGGGPEAPPQGSRIAGQEPGRSVRGAGDRRCRRPTATRRAPPTRTWPRRSRTSSRARICKDDLHESNDLQRAARQRRRRGRRADDGRAVPRLPHVPSSRSRSGSSKACCSRAATSREVVALPRRLARPHAPGDPADAATSRSTPRASPWPSTCSTASPSSSRACGADRRGATPLSLARSSPCEHSFWRFWSRPRPVSVRLHGDESERCER